MARTKQTAKKSNGGKAKKKSAPPPKAPEANKNTFYISPPSFANNQFEKKINQFCEASNIVTTNNKKHKQNNLKLIKCIIAVAKGKIQIIDGIQLAKAKVATAIRNEIEEIKTDVNIFGIVLHEFLQNFDNESFDTLSAVFESLDTMILDESNKFTTLCDEMGSFEDIMLNGTEKFQKVGRERDQALQNWFHLSKLKNVGLTSWLRINQNIMDIAMETKNFNMKTLLESYKMNHIKPGVEVFKAQGMLNTNMNQLVDNNIKNIISNEKVITAAEKIITEIHNYKTTLRFERLKIRKLLYDSKKQLVEPKSIFGNRVVAACILKNLFKYKSIKDDLYKAFKKAKSAYNDAKDDSESEEEGDDMDPELKKLKQKKEDKEHQYHELLRKKDVLLDRLRSVCEQTAKFEATKFDEEICYSFYFPEILVDGMKMFMKKKRKRLSPEQKKMESFLQRHGLLAEGRSNKDYDHRFSPTMPELLQMEGTTLQKRTNISGAFLKGTKTEKNGWKVLKKKSMSEFWGIYRAIVHANRIRHRGVVAIECAFIEGTNVVLQSQFYQGGDMRYWCKNKSEKSKIIAFSKIAEALSYLHKKGIIHRDIKPENIVFDSSNDDGYPALCDFDISKDMNETNVTTMGLVGTWLYMPPERNTKFKRDIFSLGVAMIDVLCYDGNLNSIPTTDNGAQGMTLDLKKALVKLRSMEAKGEGMEAIVKIIALMTDIDPEKRPKAAEVSSKLKECVQLFDLRSCPICMEAYQVNEMLRCETCDKFCCKRCFGMHVKTEIGKMTIKTENLYSICCFQRGSGCKGAFSAQKSAPFVPSEVFKTYFKKSEELITKKLEIEKDKDMEKMKRELLEKSREEMALLIKRQEIVDITYLKCPRCKRVFLDYNGCAALTCSGEGGCGAHFCALCQIDCGADAHSHVKECALNPQPGGYFVSEDKWKSIINEEKRKKLLSLWNTLNEKEVDIFSRDKVVRDIFKDLNMAIPGERINQYARELVELCYLTNGNHNDEEMLEALRATRGNVQQAYNLYFAL
eukprot:g8605.t1